MIINFHLKNVFLKNYGFNENSYRLYLENEKIMVKLTYLSFNYSIKLIKYFMRQFKNNHIAIKT